MSHPSPCFNWVALVFVFHPCSHFCTWIEPIAHLSSPLLLSLLHTHTTHLLSSSPLLSSLFTHLVSSPLFSLSLFRLNTHHLTSHPSSNALNHTLDCSSSFGSTPAASTSTDAFGGGSSGGTYVCCMLMYVYMVMAWRWCDYALLCFALLCFALLCFALLCFALLCFASLHFTSLFVCLSVCTYSALVWSTESKSKHGYVCVSMYKYA